MSVRIRGGTFGHRHAQREGHVKTLGEGELVPMEDETWLMHHKLRKAWSCQKVEETRVYPLEVSERA